MLVLQAASSIRALAFSITAGTTSLTRCLSSGHSHHTSKQSRGLGRPGRSQKDAALPASARALLQGIRTHIAEFQISPESAAQHFEQYQQKQCMGFHPPGLMQRASIEPCYIPFWSFSVTMSCKYTCSIGSMQQGERGANNEMVWTAKNEWTLFIERQEWGHESPLMQVRDQRWSLGALIRREVYASCSRDSHNKVLKKTRG
jgi:hypothetical protein